MLPLIAVLWLAQSAAPAPAAQASEVQRAPVMLFGRVLDPSGKPVPNATVELSGIFELPDHIAASGGDVRQHGHRLKTDAQGRFELRGLDRGLKRSQRREVRACSPVFPPTRWRPFGAPETEVVLQFAEPAFVDGRVAVPEGVDPKGLHIQLSYEGDLPLRGDTCTGVRPESDGSFRLCLPAEPCSLALWIDSGTHTLDPHDPPDLVLGGVVPKQEELTWDLRGSLHVYELAVLTPDGKPADSPNLFYPSGGKSMFQPFSGAHGRSVHRILSIDRPLTVRVEEEGFRTASITLDGPRGELKLAPGIPVKVAIANLPELGEGGFLGLELLAADGVNPKARGAVDRQGQGEVVAPEEGTYAVFLQYKRRTGSTVWSGATSWGVELPALEVSGRDDQSFTLTLPEELAALFRREAEQRR